MREITIGRDPHCDICIGVNDERVSREHGRIYQEGSNLYFKDTSTNGTIVCGRKINGISTKIINGEEILLAGKHQLTWSQINQFFPQHTHDCPTQRKVEMPREYQETVRHEEKPKEPETLHDWNWGAFLLYPIWGFGNGCWWGILICIIAGASLIPNFVFGVYGNRWAWKNRSWSSVEDYIYTQKSWTKAGLIIYGAVFALTFVTVFLASLEGLI